MGVRENARVMDWEEWELEEKSRVGSERGRDRKMVGVR